MMPLKEMIARRDALNIQLQELVAPAKSEARFLTEEEQSQVDTLLDEIKKADDGIKAKAAHDETMQRIGDIDHPSGAKAGTTGPDEYHIHADMGEAFVKSDQYAELAKRLKSGAVGTFSMTVPNVGHFDDVLGKANVKELTTQTGQPDLPKRLPGYQSLILDEGLGFLDLITTGRTDASYLEYAQVIAETDNAAIVPEGELKPLSEIQTDKADAKAHVYADGFVVTNQELADDGALAAIMRARIAYHVRNAVIDRIINGAGTANDPLGILNATGVQQQAFDTDMITTLARAMATAETYQVDPQAIVMNPADIWTLRLLKNTHGDYVFGGPQSVAPFNIWGVPVVRSNRISAGTALTGSFRDVMYLEREPLSVVAFNQHEDFARRNKVYVRAETRGLQMIKVPRDLIVVTLA